METTLSIISQLPENKEQSISFVNQVLSILESGTENPLTFKIKIKAILDTFESIYKDDRLNDMALREAEKYGQKSIDFTNAKITVKESGVKYDYSLCNDSVYSDLEAKKKGLDIEIKIRQTFLKSLTEQVANIDTGEVIHPPVKFGKLNTEISLK